MRDADALGDRARIVDVLAGAAGALAVGRLAMVVELQRDADDVIALGLEQRRRDRGIDAARHRDDDAGVLGPALKIELNCASGPRPSRAPSNRGQFGRCRRPYYRYARARSHRWRPDRQFLPPARGRAGRGMTRAARLLHSVEISRNFSKFRAWPRDCNVAGTIPCREVSVSHWRPSERSEPRKSGPEPAHPKTERQDPRRLFRPDCRAARPGAAAGPKPTLSQKKRADYKKPARGDSNEPDDEHPKGTERAPRSR